MPKPKMVPSAERVRFAPATHLDIVMTMVDELVEHLVPDGKRDARTESLVGQIRNAVASAVGIEPSPGESS